MNKLNTFTSTGSKLLNHPDLCKSLQYKKAIPITLQIAPTSICNLNCSFCSNSKRKKHESLDIEKIKYLLTDLMKIGLKSVEITGGGDPTMYSHINSLIQFSYNMGLEVAMITNGVLLQEKIQQKSLDMLKWLRVSINSIEYVDEIDIPEIKGTLGFSLCMHHEMINKSDFDIKLLNHVKKYNPSYVRVVPDCLPGEDEENLRQTCKKIVSFYGKPFFFQDKIFTTPDRCWWNYIKPFLLHDEYVYPCSSVVLNSGAEGVFHHKYKWVHMSQLKDIYDSEIVPYPIDGCNRCVFSKQNNDIDSIINPTGMENFI